MTYLSPLSARVFHRPTLWTALTQTPTHFYDIRLEGSKEKNKIKEGGKTLRVYLIQLRVTFFHSPSTNREKHFLTKRWVDKETRTAKYSHTSVTRLFSDVQLTGNKLLCLEYIIPVGSSRTRTILCRFFVLPIFLPSFLPSNLKLFTRSLTLELRTAVRYADIVYHTYF